MDALISARAGTALLVQGSELASIHAYAPDQEISRRDEEVHLLFGEAEDLQVLEDVDRDEVVRKLTQEMASTEVLQLSLILLDSEMPGEIRREAAEELDGWLGNMEHRDGVERVLYAHPLPPTADLHGALAYSKGHAPHVQDFLHHLAELQPTIVEVRRAWIGLPARLFANPAERHRLQVTLVRQGLFRALVLVRRDGKPLESFLSTALLQPVLSKIDGYSSAMQHWIAEFRVHPLITQFRPHLFPLPFHGHYGDTGLQDQFVDFASDAVQNAVPRLFSAFRAGGLKTTIVMDQCASRSYSYSYFLSSKKPKFDLLRERQATEWRSSAGLKGLLEEVLGVQVINDAAILTLEEALKVLYEVDPRGTHVVKLHTFVGLTFDEIAQLFALGRITVLRDWNHARLWLARYLTNPELREVMSCFASRRSGS